MNRQLIKTVWNYKYKSTVTYYNIPRAKIKTTEILFSITCHKKVLWKHPLSSSNTSSTDLCSNERISSLSNRKTEKSDHIYQKLGWLKGILALKPTADRSNNLGLSWDQ